MLDRIAAALGTFNKDKIAVAVSGGADSVFLLTALHQLNRAQAILHINHKLRGSESDADEAFVRNLAAQHNLPFHSDTLPPPEGNTEQEARRLRYNFFATCLAQNLCDAVATGHTLDDQAETVLFRFLRGSGTAGLSGIRPATAGGIIRPLLEIRRAEIRDYLKSRHIPWREDASNANTDYQRNRIRHNILPELTHVNPALPNVLASTAIWARDEEDYWTTELDRLEPLHLQPNPETVILNIEPFAALPVAVQRRLLRRAIERVRGNLRAIGFHHVEAIRAITQSREGSGRIQLPDLDIFRSFDQLRLAPAQFDSRQERNFSVPITIPGRTKVPERRLTIDMEQFAPSDVYNGDVNALDWAKCRGSLQLRNWRPGDQLERADRPGAAVKIKTLFQEYRIPLWERRRWPVIVLMKNSEDADIVWTRKFGAARQFAASADSKSVIVVRDLPVVENQIGSDERL